MTSNVTPVLSVIVRRYKRRYEDDVDGLVKKTQKIAASQPGFLGVQNSLSHTKKFCEMVTVFAFDSRQNLEKWECSPVRKVLISELDEHSIDSSTHAQFEGLSVLQHPRANLSRIEIVAILILWILIVGSGLNYLADLALPATFDPLLRNVLLITLNVVIISYALLPWSSLLLTRIKRLFAGK